MKGMLVGAACALAIVIVGAWLNPFSFQSEMGSAERLGIAIKASVLPAIFLAASVGRLAKHRFFTPEDIDGGGLTRGTERAMLLQSLLQNTLEQFALAVVAYCAWAVVMPATWLSVVPLAAVAFAVGRVMFFSGYEHGAPSRAIGFTLSFYPSVLMLACVVLAMFI
ncbi:hypothetical protein GCM10028792_05840 [Salinisphaera aquimarina]